MTNVIPLHKLGSGSPRPDRGDRDWATGPEVCIEAGITYRQLDYWTRTGLLHTATVDCPGSGRLRGYPNHQVDRARAIKELLDAGVSLQIIRAHLDDLLETGVIDIGPVTITRRTPPETA